jgi:choline kinase
MHALLILTQYMKTDIIILAAGVGSRLRPLTDLVPKCLVTVNGEAILERLLKQIDATTNLTKNIFIVTGYKAEVLMDFVDNLGIRVNYVPNFDFASTNNMYSLNLALKQTDPEANFVIINADCFYDQQIVSDVLHAGGNFIAVDKGMFNAESMKVKTDAEGRITAMAKSLTEAPETFVSMDIYCLTKEFKQSLLQITDEIINAGDLNSWTEVALDLLSRTEHRIFPLDFTSKNWMEIDDHSDLKKAEEIFGEKLIKE